MGSGPTDFCSLSKTNFTAGESMYFRNLTISLFQGYQITDTLINGEYEDPLNPGQMITGPVDSKKSVYINKVWGNRLSEAYRDCFISKDTNFKYKNTATFPNGTNIPAMRWSSYLQDDVISDTNNGYFYTLRSWNTTSNAWNNSVIPATEYDTIPYYGYLVNQSMLDLIDAINAKGLLGQLSSMTTIVDAAALGAVAGSTKRLHAIVTTSGLYNVPALNSQYNIKDLVPGLLAKLALASHSSINIKNSIKQVLIEQGFDEGMITSALRSVIPIGFDNTKYNSSFDSTSGVLTIQNQTPAKLKTRYKKSIQNPGNEQLYILIPRFMNRAAIENPYGSTQSGTTDVYISISSVSYPATQKVIDGEVVDNTTQRIRQQDYTAISIGVTGNGETDLEYDLLDVIDYIDSFTAMVKIPNKF